MGDVHLGYAVRSETVRSALPHFCVQSPNRKEALVAPLARTSSALRAAEEFAFSPLRQTGLKWARACPRWGFDFSYARRLHLKQRRLVVLFAVARPCILSAALLPRLNPNRLWTDSE